MNVSPFAMDRKFVSPEIYDGFFAVIDRLETTLADENRALRRHEHRGLDEFTRQKRQGFLELDRIMRAMTDTIPSQDILTRLAEFRAKLAENDKVLQTHLKAAQEITDIIVRVMRESESDGTYGRTSGHADYDFA